MNALIKTACAVAICAVLSPALLAQWPTYSSYPVPRLPNGDVNLTAPAPRTPDGRPDFNGVWRGAPMGQRGQPPPVATTGFPLATFRDIGSTFKDGLPLTPYGSELLKKRTAGNSKDNPEAHCLPMGIMQFHTQGMPRKFVQTPGLIVILYEASSGIRQIFTDGRPLPPKEDRSRGITDTPRASGMAIRWSSRPTTCATTGGSTSSGRL